MDIKENIKRFEEIVAKTVRREGIEALMGYVKKSDFYSAPASTCFHLACEGGLLQHSLNVYDCLMAKRQSPIWKRILEKYTDESLAIISLFHDLCKTYFYVAGTKNQKTYDEEKVAAASPFQIKSDSLGKFIWETVPSYSIEDQMPLGHGEKSALLISNYMRLEVPEMYAIRWHMGFSENESNYKALGQAMEKYPLILALNEADLEAAKLLEVGE